MLNRTHFTTGLEAMAGRMVFAATFVPRHSTRKTSPYAPCDYILTGVTGEHLAS